MDFHESMLGQRPFYLGETMLKTRHLLARTACALSLAVLPAFAQEGSMHYSLGVTYVGGLQDVVDFYNTEHNGSTSTLIPVGVRFSPYYEFKNGLRLNLDLGPLAMVAGDVNFTDVPLGATIGYAFAPSSDDTAYIRVGVRQHMASGSDVDGSSAGLFAALGTDFSRDRRVHWGFEVAVDTATVDFRGYNPAGGNDPLNGTLHSIKPGKFLASVQVTF